MTLGLTRSAPDEREASSAGSALLEVRDLSVRFNSRGREVHAVDKVSYSVEPGQTLAVIGESGSGKTVSARAIMGLLPEGTNVSGSARFQGAELIGLGERRLRAYRGARISMVFQDPARSLHPTMRIGNQITETILAHLPMSRSQARRRAVELLEMVRIPSAAHRFAEYPHELSGGMQQRVMIAIALSCRPKLLIADEATTALDVTTQAKIMNLLMELQRELDMALVMISHNMGLAASYSDEVLVMYAGRVVEHAPTKTLFDHVRMPYTKVLLEAVPRLERAAHSRPPVIVAGRPPDLSALPSGCSFHPRCPYARDRCREEEPALLEHEPGHRFACFFPVAGGPVVTP